MKHMVWEEVISSLKTLIKVNWNWIKNHVKNDFLLAYVLLKQAQYNFYK